MNKQTSTIELQSKHSAPTAADRLMFRNINIASLLCMIAAPLLIDGLLRAVSVYIDTYIAVFYPTTSVAVLQWMLYYLLLILSFVYQSASYSILGYTVMRYGVRRSKFPIILIVVSATIAYAAGIMEFIYLSGTSAIKNNPVYYITYWAINYFLSLFTCLCIIFLCALLRTSFQRKKRTGSVSFRKNPGMYTAKTPDNDSRFSVGITEEDAQARKTNVLRRLYFGMTALLFVFRFVPTVTNMISEIRRVGAPYDIWDWITLLQPYFELLLLTAMGYFVMLHVGSVLTERNHDAHQSDAENDSVS